MSIHFLVPSCGLLNLRNIGLEIQFRLECRHIIVCDGYKCASDSKFRSGVVTAERAHAYVARWSDDAFCEVGHD